MQRHMKHAGNHMLETRMLLNLVLDSKITNVSVDCAL